MPALPKFATAKATPMPPRTTHTTAPELKFTPLDLKRVEPDGTFAGYASLFDTEDLGHDIVAARRLPRQPRRARRRRHQAALPAQPRRADRRVGHPSKRTPAACYARGRLMLAVARAREVLALMRAGALDGLSIGFRAVTATATPSTGIRRLAKVDLWEISIVTFPLLPEARVAHVKSHGRHRLAASIAAATNLPRSTNGFLRGGEG